MPELSFAYSYGNFVYNPDTNGLTSLKMPLRFKERVAATPGRDGGYSGGGLMDTRTVTAKGSIVAPDSVTMRALRDAFYAAHAPGVARKLVLNTDRYFLCEVSGLDESEEDGRPYWEYTLSFRADDPYQYDVAVQTPTLSSPFTPGGTALALPVITLAVGAAPAGGSITVSNSATGQSFVLAPAQAATYVIDTAGETVTQGGADASAQQGAGSVFVQLAAGVPNLLSATAAGGASVNSFSAQYQNRWY